ncbi:MAG: EAL domain-containing protein [Halopseudomonas sp.]
MSDVPLPNKLVRLQVIAWSFFLCLTLLIIVESWYLISLNSQSSKEFNQVDQQTQQVYRDVDHMLQQRQPLEQLSNQIINSAEHFNDEFQLLILDPDYSDAGVRVLQGELQQQADKLKTISTFIAPAISDSLKENLGVLLDITAELLETPSPNDRQQLYRDTSEPLLAIISAQTLLLNQFKIENQQLSQDVFRATEQSHRSMANYAQFTHRFELSVWGVSLFALVANSLILALLFYLFRRRLVKLSDYAEAIGQQQFAPAPFSSGDITGNLAKNLEKMGGHIHQLLDLSQQEAQRANDAHAEAEQLAFYDPLTGLENRRLFYKRLEHDLSVLERHSEDSLALFYLDLDDFKQINDTLGHKAGDEVLKSMADRLRLTLREEESLARLGGDEFAILFHGSQETCANLADRILRKMQVPLTIDGQVVRFSTSIGIAIAGEDGNTTSELMSHADLALYQAKALGRNNYQYYSPDLQQRAQTRVQLTHEIDNAISGEEFTLHYQPKVNLCDRRLAGLEALIRWKHPTRGMVFPGEFIALVEDTGQILPISNWLIEQACQQIQVLQHRGRAIPISINISAKHFYTGDLVNQIRRQLDTYQIDPKLLEIEITESLLMDNMQQAIQTLETIRSIGVRTSIDDFGTGFSSMAYLKQLPLDAMKVDREFVRHLPNGLKDVAITQTIIELAHRLNLPVIAEGVETEAQLKCLEQMGCEMVQGYLFSKPAPIAELNLGPTYTCFASSQSSTV